MCVCAVYVHVCVSEIMRQKYTSTHFYIYSVKLPDDSRLVKRGPTDNGLTLNKKKTDDVGAENLQCGKMNQHLRVKFHNRKCSSQGLMTR